ncbi:MAG: methyl-accepting chemotaxis protein [Chloroflexota bacterium]|nr:hypothetical protein [Chloroflexota bacterium]
MTAELNYDEKTLVKEAERKANLLRLFCLIEMVVTSGMIFILIMAALAGADFGPIFVGLLALLFQFITALVISRLAFTRWYTLVCWIMISTSALPLMPFHVQYGTSIPLTALYLFPIAMCAVLLKVRETVALTAICVLFNLTLIIVQNILHLYTPFEHLQEQSLVGTDLFIAGLVLPGVAALMIFPLKSQAGLLQIQNRQLIQALRELETRQLALEETSRQVLGLSSELKGTSEEQTAGSQEQAANVVQVKASVTELANTAVQIAELAQTVNQAVGKMVASSQEIETTARLSTSQSQYGLEAVQQTIAVCQKVTLLYQQLSATLHELDSKSSNTRTILKLLNSIGDETHLLALNASIEAAGAGEYGERFGVVAREVKNLANRSKNSSQEVVQIINQIETAIKETTHVVETGYVQAEEMAQVASKAGQVIDQMRQIAVTAEGQAISINHVSEGVRVLSETIKIATLQQRTASEGVLSALSDLTVIAEQNTQGSLRVHTFAADLEEMSRQLKVTLKV